MEVKGDSNETMKILMGKEVDKKLNKTKAKKKKEKKKNNPSAGAHKNWPERRKRHERRWGKNALIKK